MLVVVTLIVSAWGPYMADEELVGITGLQSAILYV